MGYSVVGSKRGQLSGNAHREQATAFGILVLALYAFLGPLPF